jgi:hypothetical protein
VNEQKIFDILKARGQMERHDDSMQCYLAATPYLSLRQIHRVINDSKYVKGYVEACVQELMERKLLGKKKLRLNEKK